MKLHTIAAVAAATMAFAVSDARAADSCGWFAFAGAFKNYGNAERRANRHGGSVWSLDSSDSPNAGKGFWVVARGPGNRNSANRWKRDYQYSGVGSAYVSRRCFYGE